MNVRKGEFFKVLGGTEKSQIAVMSIKPGEDSGEEGVHTGDQILYVIDGEARAVVAGEEEKVKQGEALIIPAKTKHRIYNDGPKELFSLNFYAPPQY